MLPLPLPLPLPWPLPLSLPLPLPFPVQRQVLVIHSTIPYEEQLAIFQVQPLSP
jgi:hypothetical protein